MVMDSKMPSHSKNNLYQRPVRKWYWSMQFRNPGGPEPTGLMQHPSTRTQVFVETTGSLCSPYLQPVVLTQRPTGNTTCVLETQLIPAVAPIKSSFLSAGISVTFTPCLSQKQLRNPFPRKCEPASFARSGLWGCECCLSPFYPQGCPHLVGVVLRMTGDEICKSLSTVPDREEVQGKCWFPSLCKLMHRIVLIFKKTKKQKKHFSSCVGVCFWSHPTENFFF